MAKRQNKTSKIPTIEELKREINREKNKKSHQATVRSTVYTLIIVAAISVLVAVLYLPVLRIYGNSMTPTLQSGDIYFRLKKINFKVEI